MGLAQIRITKTALLRLIRMATTGNNQPPEDAKILRVVNDPASDIIVVGIHSEVLPEHERGASWPTLTEIVE